MSARVEVTVRRCVYCSGLGWEEVDGEERCTNERCGSRDFRTGRATLIGRDALVYALGEAAEAVALANEEGERGATTKAASAWLDAADQYDAALAALRAFDEGRTDDK